MKSTVIIILCLLTQQLFSQETPEKFGKISQKEINLKYYKGDPDAGAVILFDIGKSIFVYTDNRYDIRFTRTKRIKIFKKEAFKYAEVIIPFYTNGYGETETVGSIEAYTYNYENGQLKKTALDLSTVYEEKTNNRWRAKKFVFPNVKEGSILEYRYTLETPFHFNLPDWTFQSKIPTIYSQYTVRMIPFYEYVFMVQGITHFDYQKSVIAPEKRTWGNVSKVYGKNIGSGIEFRDYVHTYVLKNIPAFKDESYITSVNDYIIKLDFQLAKFHSPTGSITEIITTWPKLNKALLTDKKFGKYLKSSQRLAKNIFKTDINLKNKTEREKSKIIVNYVKSNFTWNGINAKYASKSSKDFFKQKTGNSADINLFLTALFKYAGFDAYPLILSTRKHGKIRINYPYDHLFNYVVVYVKNKNPFLTDGTDKYLPYNRIPLRCINEEGLVVKPGSVKWISLTNNNIAQILRQITINIDPVDLKSEITSTFSTTNYIAYNYKKEFHNDTTKIKDFLLNKSITKISNIKTYNYNKTTIPYIINFKGKSNVEKFGSNLVISPFLDFAITKNWFTQKTRSYPVDMTFPKAENFKIIINVPKGYKITQLPKPYKLNNYLMKINLEYQQNNRNILTINGGFTFKKSIYQADEYTRLKYYIDIIIKKFNKQIVLEKIK